MFARLGELELFDADFLVVMFVVLINMLVTVSLLLNEVFMSRCAHSKKKILAFQSSLQHSMKKSNV